MNNYFPPMPPYAIFILDPKFGWRPYATYRTEITARGEWLRLTSAYAVPMQLKVIGDSTLQDRFQTPYWRLLESHLPPADAKAKLDAFRTAATKGYAALSKDKEPE